MNKNMGEILVAGGAGLVGRNLTDRLIKEGLPFISTRHKGGSLVDNHDLIAFDFSEFQDCLSVTKGVQTIVLCAAVSFGAKRNKEMPTAAILPNLKIFAGLFEACARNNVKTVIMLSSSTIYQPTNYPIKEDDLDLNQAPYQGYFGVGWLYRYLEQLATLYSMIYGIKMIILRPTNIYGPFDKFNEADAHVIPSLIRRALNSENPFEIWGSPTVVRDFIFIDDLVGDILSIIKGEVNVNNLPVNICSENPVTIKNAAEVVLQSCNYKTEIYFNLNKPSAIPYRAVDSSRYRKIFGNKKRTSLEEGIKKTVKWYKEHKNKV